jgi:acetyltransferase-like isoleucine patch superfamily enzyme
LVTGTKISWRSTLRLYGGDIEIADDCSVNPFCVLYGYGGLKLGKGMRITSHTVLIPTNHGYEDLDMPIWCEAETRRGIVIEDDAGFGIGEILQTLLMLTNLKVYAGRLCIRWCNFFPHR